MKRYGNLFDDITSFQNILSAYKKARLRKAGRSYVIDFSYNLEKEILRIQKSLLDGSYSTGRYKSFYIYEPKKRLISAAPFVDRVVHHCLCNIIEPIYEKTFIHHTYANRKRKGSHAAVAQYQKLAKEYPFVLKCDIKKYFPNIDHEILKELIRKKIKCSKTLKLIDLIIDSSNPQEETREYFDGDDLFTPSIRRKGLPIGNLTSQFFGNVYLNGFDHYVTEVLNCRGYVRYVDDFVLFSDSSQKLLEWKKEIESYLGLIRLRLNDKKSIVYRTAFGVNFLGYKMFPSHILLKPSNKRKIKCKISKFRLMIANQLIPLEKVRQSIASWLGYARFADSFRFRSQLLAGTDFAEYLDKKETGRIKDGRGNASCGAVRSTTTTTTSAVPIVTTTTLPTSTTTLASVP